MQASRLLGSPLPPTTDSSIAKSDSLNKDDFLKLLLTQMQHQDPLNPMDNTEFLSQLSQFSQLEQIYNVNQNIQDLAVAQGSIRDSLLANLLGKTAKVEASEVYLKGQDEINLTYELVDFAPKVTANIYDADSHRVKTIQMLNQGSGLQKIDWDGTDDNGQKLPEGTYIVEITVHNQGESNWVKPYLIGQVHEVIFSQGNDPLIRVENQSVPISGILQIMDQPES